MHHKTKQYLEKHTVPVNFNSINDKRWRGVRVMGCLKGGVGHKLLTDPPPPAHA
jgi:hypothetical protein